MERKHSFKHPPFLMCQLRLSVKKSSAASLERKDADEASSQHSARLVICYWLEHIATLNSDQGGAIENAKVASDATLTKEEINSQLGRRVQED